MDTESGQRKTPQGEPYGGEGGEIGQLSAVAGEGAKGHKGNEEGGEEEIAKGAKEVAHRNCLPSTTSKRNPRGPSLLSITGRTRSEQSEQNTLTDT